MMDFALIGAAGYIAPRHMKAIKETGNNLIAALDKHDSVGVLDSFFPDAAFFTEFERFDRHLDKLRREKRGVDFVSVCTPNYLHDSHIRFALRQNSNAICEKPLVLNPWNVDALETFEQEYGKRIYNILQLRLHPALLALKAEIGFAPKNKKYEVDVTYITSRGSWYFASWKGDNLKSGGIATNIGIHFFDMLIWIFGPVEKATLHLRTHDRESGFLELQNARVRWFLSIDSNVIPNNIRAAGQRTFRSIKVNDTELEFTEGFVDLHTKSYQQILDGKGFTLSDCRDSVHLAFDIRSAQAVGLIGDYHPFSKLPLSRHPFNH